MRAQVRPRTPDQLIAALADRQHGVVERQQLLRRGISRDAITRRIRSGRLRPVHRGVYLVGHRAAAPLAYEAAAVLACAPNAVISHRSAAVLHKLLPYPAQADVWVTITSGDHSRRPGLVVRRGVLDPRDVTRIQRIPLTSPARTILDCAAILPKDDDARLERMCAEAHALKLARLPDLREQIQRNPGRRGVRRLTNLLDRHSAPARTRLRLEARLLRLVRSSDLPEPETNQWVHGREVDMLWRTHRLVVEADSYTFHSHSKPWARDIGKTNELQLRGYVVLRFTWFDVTERPGWVIAEIRRAVALRSPAP